MVNFMLDDYDGTFIPDIGGLSKKDYIATKTAVLTAGFLAGYSLLENSIVVGTVTSCGFTRLAPIGRKQAGHIFHRAADLIAALDGMWEADEQVINPTLTRDWKNRPANMRSAAFAAMVKTGFIFDTTLRYFFGRPSDDEINIVFLRALHDQELRAALGDTFECWARKHMKKNAKLPPESEPDDFLLMRKAGHGSHGLMDIGDQVNASHSPTMQ